MHLSHVTMHPTWHWPSRVMRFAIEASDSSSLPDEVHCGSTPTLDARSGARAQQLALAF